MAVAVVIVIVIMVVVVMIMVMVMVVVAAALPVLVVVVVVAVALVFVSMGMVVVPVLLVLVVVVMMVVRGIDSVVLVGVLLVVVALLVHVLHTAVGVQRDRLRRYARLPVVVVVVVLAGVALVRKCQPSRETQQQGCAHCSAPQAKHEVYVRAVHARSRRRTTKNVGLFYRRGARTCFLGDMSSCDCTQWLKYAGALLLPAATWLALWSKLPKPYQFRLAANTGKEAEAVTYPEYEVSAHVSCAGKAMLDQMRASFGSWRAALASSCHANLAIGAGARRHRKPPVTHALFLPAPPSPPRRCLVTCWSLAVPASWVATSSTP